MNRLWLIEVVFYNLYLLLNFLTLFLNFISRFTGWGKKDEPDVDIIEITEIPADFDMTQEAISEGECYRITLVIM